MQQTLENVLARGIEKTSLGKVATYIPELGKVDPNQLGISVFTRYGERISVGDATVRFTIQSVSKIISLAVALERMGTEKVFRNVGMEPSGDAFNALVKLENADSTPYNPMINAGAIVIANYLAQDISFDEMIQITRSLCLDPEITLDESVCRSEMAHISRNRAIAYLLESKGYISEDVESTLDFYVRMCSLRVTSDSLANLASVLAKDGREPVTGERFMSHRAALLAKTIMLTCGMYDGSGEFAVKVGLPAKSGVGGGLMAVSDRRLGIGIFSPELDSKGNSVAGQHVLEHLSTELNLHIFGRDTDQFKGNYIG